MSDNIFRFSRQNVKSTWKYFGSADVSIVCPDCATRFNIPPVLLSLDGVVIDAICSCGWEADEVLLDGYGQ